MMLLRRFILVSIAAFATLFALAQTTKELKGKVADMKGNPLQYATITVTPSEAISFTIADGTFSLLVPANLKEMTITVSHVGKSSLVKTIKQEQLGLVQYFILSDLNLKLPDVEVNALRKSTTASNSSIVFNREAIEQTQSLSIANVLNYLPGQTIIKSTVSVQGNQNLNLRSGLTAGTLAGFTGATAQQTREHLLNESFGLTFMVDGNAVSNDANMQANNPGFMGLFSANNIQNPDAVLPDRGQRNGTLYSNYGGIFGNVSANNGIDMRSLSAENIESIEVITGVASARYGNYSTGMVNILRQAGQTPLRINLRNSEGSFNAGINKGLKLNKGLGNININFDYLSSNDDPRDKLKAFQRVSGGLMWTYQQKKRSLFKNTFNIDYRSTIDQTHLDPDLDNMRMAKLNNSNLSITNRSFWQLKKKWLNSITLNAAYNYGKQESYDQWYLNSAGVIGVTPALQTGTYEGYFIPGYYLAAHHIIGEPVNGTASLETESIFKLAKKAVYKLVLGGNYYYSANKGAGVVSDPDRPRFDNQGYKNDRPRSFSNLPTIQNAGMFAENIFYTNLFSRPLMANIGVRGDFQNSFFTLSPRANASWELSKKISWKISYGIAAKAPSLSQISPGNVYMDVPLISAYNGSANNSLYLAHTEVVNLENIALKPYKSYTFETGFSFNTKPVQLSFFYMNRENKDGFATVQTVVPLTLPNYTVTNVPGQKPTYVANGTTSKYYTTYSKISNANYSRTNSYELMVRTAKLRSIQTSFDFTTSLYYSYYLNTNDDVNIGGGDGQTTIDFTKEAVFGVFRNTAVKARSMQSRLTSTTHIPALRMAVMLTTEFFWVNRSESLASDIYPSGYLDFQGNYHALTLQQAQSSDYAHLLKKASAESVKYTPAKAYQNMHLRLSKEITDVLRMSFNAYNVFNLRPQATTISGTNYFNGRPSYGAELIFTIK